MAIAGLTLAAEYFSHPDYLCDGARGGRFYYDDFATVGFTSGGCGDILQNRETAVALATSMITLYEATGEQVYLGGRARPSATCAPRGWCRSPTACRRIRLWRSWG